MLNKKVSLSGKMFLRKTKPYVTILGWMTFVAGIVGAVLQGYSILKGVLFVGGIQISYGILVLVIMGFLLYRHEQKQ